MSLVATAKTAYDLAKKGMTVEFQEKIMQLREEALELQEETLRLRNENTELKEKLEWKQKLDRKKALYWCDGDEVPFCPYCWEKNKLAIHLSLYKEQSQGRTVCKCEECKITYGARGEDDFLVIKSRSST